jgi:hypothetical protein
VPPLDVSKKLFAMVVLVLSGSTYADSLTVRQNNTKCLA